MVPLCSTHRGGSRLVLRRLGRGQKSGFSAFFEPIAFAANVHGCRVMQQPIQDGGRDDRVTEDSTPLAIALVRSQNDAAAFVAGTDQLEEDSGARSEEHTSELQSRR